MELVRWPADGAKRAYCRARDLTAPTVDADHILYYRGRSVVLSPVEGRLAAMLAHAYRRVVTRQLLTERIWPGRPPDAMRSTCMCCVCAGRSPRSDSPSGPCGDGYLLASDDR